MAELIAHVLLDTADQAITPERLLARIHADWLDLRDATTGATSDANLIFVNDGDHMIAIVPVDAPAEDTRNATRHFWPHATPPVDTHRAHLAVTVFTAGAPEDHLTALAQAALLSQVIASIVALSTRVSAVHWPAAGLLIFPEAFREIALENLPMPLLPLWVAVSTDVADVRGPSGVTRGLHALNLMDIEVVPTAADVNAVLSLLVRVAEHQLDHGPHLRDGDTIGDETTVDVVVRHAPSSSGDGRIVLQLTPVARRPRT